MIKQRHETAGFAQREHRVRKVESDLPALSRELATLRINELAMGRHGLIKAAVIEWPMSARELTLS